jgi:hypothetical protein
MIGDRQNSFYFLQQRVSQSCENGDISKKEEEKEREIVMEMGCFCHRSTLRAGKEMQKRSQEKSANAFE